MNGHYPMMTSEHLAWYEKFYAAYLAKERSVKQNPLDLRAGQKI